MDAVRVFNNELSSLYESKPPVSRAKMAQITKCAIKAIKFYKHVVQSVEKFIQKCKPEYKVPGLYVIDSIVRQSKHQFGPEKDVFSPRFTKNIVSTFVNLFKCPVEERNRIVRVLNLWHKNSVFPLELIQPLLDLAADPDNPNLISAAHRAANGIISTSQKVSLPVAQPSNNSTDSNSNPVLQQTEMLSTINKLLQQAQEGTITSTAPESQLQHLQSLQEQLAKQTERISKPQEQPTPPIDSGLLAQIQVLTSQLLNKTNSTGPDSAPDVKSPTAIKEAVDVSRNVFDVHVNRQLPFDVHRPPPNSIEPIFKAEPIFNKKLLEFDYDDSDEEEDRQDHHQHHHEPQQPPQLQLLQQQQLQQQPPQLPLLQQQQLQQQPLQQQQLQQQPPQLPLLQQQQLQQQPPQLPLLQQQQLQQQPPQLPLLQQQQLQQQLPQLPLLQQQQLQQQLPQLPLLQQQQPPQLQLLQQQQLQQQPLQQPPLQPPPPLQQPPLQQPPLQQPPLQQPPLQQPPLPQPPLPQQQRQPSPIEKRLPAIMLDQNVFQHIQQIAKQQELLQSEIGGQSQFHRQLLEQQQQQFDMELEQDSMMGHPLPPLPPPPPQPMIQEQNTQMDEDQEDKDNSESQERMERADRRRHTETRERSQDRSKDLSQDRSKDRSRDRSKDRSRDRSKDRSRDKSRSPRRRSRRSRSRSRDRDRDRDRRRRSRSRDRHRRSRERERVDFRSRERESVDFRSRERERRDRDKERESERKKVGLPPLKDRYISICTTTIWVGRLTKYTTENELREHIEIYGKIRTINIIPPRGCAYVCLTKRRDAYKALDRLKGVKINGMSVKVAWAPGTGIKESSFKDLWDVDLGVTYIPWDQLPSDVVPLLVGGMVDEESLPEKLKGMKTGEEEEEEEVQPQTNPRSESGGGLPENNVAPAHLQIPLPPPPMNMSIQPPGFPLPGQNPMGLMGPGGPLSLLSGPPPPIGMPPGMRGPLGLGGPGNMRPPTAVMVSHNSMMLPNMTTISTMGNPNSIVGVAGLRGPMPPNMPMVGPRPMNMGHQIPMMGGQGNGIGIPGGTGHNLERAVNSPGPRPPFGQFNNMPRFANAHNPGGMPPPFVNNNNGSNSVGGQSVMGDSDMRAMAEPKEWPPDDEANAEDETDDHPMDSDERLLHLGGQQRMPGPGMPNLRPAGNPFGMHRPMLPGQGPTNPMIAIPRPPGMPPLIPVHMMPPPPQQVITVQGGPAPAFALAHGGMRIPMPTVGVRQGLMPAVTSPHLMPPSTGAPPPVAVSVNGSVVVTRAGVPSIPVSIGVDISTVNTEALPSDEEKQGPSTAGPVPVMQIHDNNHPPSGPVLGRCFTPMTIRPRAGPSLLGVRPGAPGGGGFNRFGGPRPIMRPAFGRMERPPFGNRFGVLLRPPVGFLDHDEREDRDERRPLPRLDGDDHSGADVPEHDLPKDIDERGSSERKDKNQDVDLRQDIDERSKLGDPSRRRWFNAGGGDETSKLASADGFNIEGNASGGTTTESTSAGEAASTPAAIKSTTDILSATSQASVTSQAESVQIIAEVSVARNDVASVVDKIISGGGDAIQPPRSNDASEKTGS